MYFRRYNSKIYNIYSIQRLHYYSYIADHCIHNFMQIHNDYYAILFKCIRTFTLFFFLFEFAHFAYIQYSYTFYMHYRISHIFVSIFTLRYHIGFFVCFKIAVIIKESAVELQYIGVLHIVQTHINIKWKIVCYF